MYKIISNSIDYGPNYVDQLNEYCYPITRTTTKTSSGQPLKKIRSNSGKTTKPKAYSIRSAPYKKVTRIHPHSKSTALTPVLDHLAAYLPPNIFNEDKAKAAIINIKEQKIGASINELERAKKLIEDYLNIKYHGYLSARGRAVSQFTLDKDIKSIYEKIKNQLSAIKCRLRKKESVKALEQKLKTLIQQCKKNESTIQELSLEVIRLQLQIDQQNK